MGSWGCNRVLSSTFQRRRSSAMLLIPCNIFQIIFKTLLTRGNIILSNNFRDAFDASSNLLQLRIRRTTLPQ